MKKTLILCAITLFFSSTTLAYAKDGVLKTKEDRYGYSIGLDLSRSIKSLIGVVDLNVDMVLKGLKDGVAGDKVLLTEEEFKKVMMTMQSEVQEKQAKLQGEQGKKNKEEGKKFLAKNAKRKGVKTTKSGLQYEVIKAGTGKSPKATDQVETHYRGTLINGKEFDSSYKRGQPATFPLNRVIPGWTEALQLMKEGAKWKIFVPSELAYGARGPSGIGPDSTLIFEIELLSVK